MAIKKFVEVAQDLDSTFSWFVYESNETVRLMNATGRTFSISKGTTFGVRTKGNKPGIATIRDTSVYGKDFYVNETVADNLVSTSKKKS